MNSIIKPAALAVAITLTGATLANAQDAATATPAPVSGATQGNTDSWANENIYWKHNYSSRPYYSSTRDYSTYEPAYQYGVNAYTRNSGKSYDQLDQAELNKGWEQARGSSAMNWNDAQVATRDAYNHMYESRSVGSSADSLAGTNQETK